MTSRRRFISLMPVPLLAASSFALAGPDVLDPKDAQAVALGYTPDAAKADKAKFPQYARPQACGKCGLYQGAPGSTSGPCPIYAGRLVQAKGWCSAFNPKAD